MSDKPVAIIILTWNALEYTKMCLETLQRVTRHDSFRVIVVDNGSVDGSIEYLQDLDFITLIQNGENLGYTKGCNIGIRATSTDEDVILMNNDILVNDSDWLSKLQSVAYSEQSVGVVGTRMVDPEGRLNHAGSYMPPIKLYGHQIGGGELDIGQYTTDREIECTIFALAYLRRDCIEKVGLLDEDLFAYFEDTEYCFRASRLGFKIMYAGGVSPVHHHNTSTRENKVDFWSIYLKSRDVFKKKWSHWLEEERYSNSIGWHSVIHSPLGYAVQSRKLMTAMHFEGIKLSYRNAYGDHDQTPTDLLLADILKRKMPKGGSHVGFCIAEAFPTIAGKRRIGWTMLEVTGLPKRWVDGCNEMDEVWVPASFNIETFKNSGVKVPIHVMPLGVDPNYFHPGIKGFRPSDKFVFLSVFEWGERKAPELLIKAFAEEFKHSDDAMLLLSVFNRDPLVNIPAEIGKLDIPDSAPITVLINPEFADYQMGALYRSADAFVLPSRGEGWGQPVLEAMACGLPVITTNWSGPTDFVTDETGYMIDYKMVPAEARCPYYEGFDWAEPDTDHLKHLMRSLYENPAHAKAKGAIAADHVAANLTWEHAAKRISQRLLGS
ncbi:MAG: glycosyltransferase [Actinomycetota bacterium]